ncbi:ubiquitin-like small modifier protein 1 [Clostridium sp.]|uniref:ubiquitin-like small modifier protein 1 n=1 Tax=Clostridium sp. TaxID=1506 RepID=UPI003D6CDA62
MKVKFFAYIRDYTKTKEVEISGCNTVLELLNLLSDKYGKNLRQTLFKNSQLSDEIIILVNGRHIIHLNGIKTEITENDEISIFPVVAGG